MKATNKITIRMMNTFDEVSYAMVEAEMIKPLSRGLAVHRDLSDCYWVVSDTETGMMVGAGETPAKAKAIAVKRLTKIAKGRSIEQALNCARADILPRLRAASASAGADRND